MKRRTYNICFIISGLGLVVFGVLSLLKNLIPVRDGITGLDFLNPIVIIIAGFIPLSVAIFRYIDNSDKKERLGFLYRTANYWLVFSTICVVVAIVIYFVIVIFTK